MYHRRKQNFGRDSKENSKMFKPRSCLDSVAGIIKTHFITQHLLIKHVNIRQPCTQAGLDANINIYGVQSQTIYLSTRLLF